MHIIIPARRPTMLLSLSSLLLVIYAFLPMNSYAWEIADHISVREGQEIVKSFLSMEEGEQKSGLGQKLCAYVIRDACSSEENSEQDTVSNIFT